MIIRPQDGVAKRWNDYATRELAEAEAAKLRRQKLFAQVRRVDGDPPEAPEHHNDRRAFLIWACMLGAVPPEKRVVERIVEEVEREGGIVTPHTAESYAALVHQLNVETQRDKTGVTVAAP